MISTFTYNTCSNCNILMAQNKQLCLDLEEAREQQRDEELLAKFACALLRVPAGKEDLTVGSLYDKAVAMLAEHKKRLRRE